MVKMPFHNPTVGKDCSFQKSFRAGPCMILSGGHDRSDENVRLDFTLYQWSRT